jgi:uncharacterized membrane protein
MGFSSPFFLLLILALPLLAWLGWPSRGPSRGREFVSLVLRVLIALLLILGLAGLEIRRQSESLSVVFLVDDSDSMRVPINISNVAATPRQLALAYVREALKEMGSSDQAGIILFGGDAVVERPLSGSQELEGVTSKVTSLQTDLAGAIRLGLALLPSDTARRMVILSDGAETAGDAIEAARLARASGTQIMVVPFSTVSGAEALVTSVKAPTRLREGEQFALEVVIASTADQRVGVRVLSGANVAYEGELQLRRGQNSFSLPLEAGSPGFASYRVQLIPPGGADTFYQNNELGAFAQIAGPPRVLMVTNPAPRDGVPGYEALLAALRASGVQVETALPRDLPSELPALSEYASVVLVDVPARALSSRQMAAIETYVRDLGGGLVAVGGPTSYGLGGYYKTSLEAALPVEMQIKDEQRFPKVSMIVVMDKSGSMSAPEGGVTKMQLADEGAARVAELMHDFDDLTIIAFDTSPVDVIGPVSGVDRDQAANRARTIGPGGGGILVLEALQYAAGIIRQSANATRHIILLADGSDAENQNGAREVAAQLANEGVTLSVVSLGNGPDTPFLRDLAAKGNGRFHLTESASSIPEIFTSETAEIQRNYIIEETFFPKQNAPSPILAGIESVPALQGYVGTTARETATTILISDLPNGYQDPILAAWQYGLGHSVAWTSDATGRWAKNWVNWDQFARFWAQAVRYTLSEGAPSNVDVQVQNVGEHAAIAVDARSEAGAYLNGLSVQANVVGPDGETQSVILQQTAPGRYSGAFTPTAEGAYLIRVAGTDPKQPSGSEAALAQTAGWVLSYSPEYQVEVRNEPETNLAPENVRFLLQLATLTGGASVTGDYEAVFEHDLPSPPSAAQPIWPWLLLAATLVLPFDIAVRRLVISRYDVQRAWQRFRVWAHLGQPRAAPMAPQRAEQLSSLFKAKDRAGTAPKPADGNAPVVVPPPIVTQPAEGKPPITPPVGAPASPSAPSASTSAALLAKKRAREKKE